MMKKPPPVSKGMVELARRHFSARIRCLGLRRRPLVARHLLHIAPVFWPLLADPNLALPEDTPRPHRVCFLCGTSADTHRGINEGAIRSACNLIR